ncbi:hypothetical protein BU17DRAFT_47830 [Hysterangium stoloniferum]|nr:hypothetical protein BU17DRAFT_47830 [Hysterangium stoloniferum]
MVPPPLGVQLQKIAKAWKFDPLRPTYQMETFLASLAKHPNLTPEAVKAADALKNNVAAQKWPITEKLSSPASMPLYYSRLLEGVEKSSKGIGRPWWKIFFNIW